MSGEFRRGEFRRTETEEECPGCDALRDYTAQLAFHIGLLSGKLMSLEDEMFPSQLREAREMVAAAHAAVREQ